MPVHLNDATQSLVDSEYEHSQKIYGTATAGVGTTLNNVTKFAAGSALAGLDSLVNSGISIANANVAAYNMIPGVNMDKLSYVNPESQAKKASKLWSLLGMNTMAQEAQGVGEMYSQNRAAEETLGQIGASVIPMGIGVKAYKAAVLGIDEGTGLLARAARNFDFASGLSDITNSEKIRTAATAVIRGGDKGAVSAARLNMITKGLINAAAESASADLATKAMTYSEVPPDNQDVNYFKRVATGFASMDELKTVGVGTALMGAVNTAKVMGAFKRGTAAFAKEVNDKTIPVNLDNYRMDNGTKLAYMRQNQARQQSAVVGMGEGEKNAARVNLDSQQHLIEEGVNKLTGNDAPASNKLLDFFAKNFGAPDAESSVDASNKFLVGLNKVTAPYASELPITGRSVYTIISTPGTQAEDTERLIDVIHASGRHKYFDSVTGKDVPMPRDAIDQMYRPKIENAFATSNGFAMSDFNILVGNPLTTQKSAYNLQTMGYLGGLPSVTQYTPEEINNIIEKVGTDRFTQTLKHERGHVLLNYLADPEAFEGRSNNFKNAFAVEVKNLSRIARPEKWAEHDYIVKQMKRDDYLTAFTQDQRDAFDSKLEYVTKPQELIADAFSMLENTQNADALRKLHPKVTTMFKEAGSLTKLLTDTRRVWDSATGNISDQLGYFNAADMGAKDLGYSNKGVNHMIQLGSGKNVRLVNVESPFIPNEIHPADAAAHWYAWLKKDNPKAINFSQPIEYGHFPKLTRALNALQDSSSGIQTIHTLDEHGNVLDFTDAADLKSHIIAMKQNFITDKMSGYGFMDADTGLKTNYNHKMIARILDTSEEYAMGNFLHKEGAIDSAIHAPDEVRHYILRYGKKSIDSIKDIGQEAHATMISQEARDLHNETAAQVLGEHYSKFPDSKFINANGIGQFDSGSTLLTQANGEYNTFSGHAAAIGHTLKDIDDIKTQQMQNIMIPLGAAIKANKSALGEYGVFESWHRGFPSVYKFNKDLIPFDEWDGINNQIAELSKAGQQIPQQLINQHTALAPMFDALDKSGASDLFRNVVGGYGEKSAIQEIHRLLQPDFDNGETFDHLALANWVNTNVGQSMKGSKFISINTPEVNNFLGKYFDLNEQQLTNKVAIRYAQGRGASADTNRVYLGPLNTGRLRHHFLVVPSNQGITDANDAGMIFATNPVDLETKKSQVLAAYGDKVKIYTEKDKEEYKKAYDLWEASNRHGDLQVDTDLRRRGILSDILPEADPMLVDDSINSLLSLQRSNLRDAVALKYAPELNKIDAVIKETERSTLSGDALSRKDIPTTSWHDLRRIMLNLSANTTDSAWLKFQQNGDQKAAAIVNAAKSAFSWANAKQDVAALDAVEEHMKRFGYTAAISPDNPAFRQAFVNAGVANKGPLTKFLKIANGIVSKGMLSYDAGATLMNNMSLPITLFPEIDELGRQFGVADGQKYLSEFVTNIPGGTNANASAIKASFLALKDIIRSPSIRQELRDMGMISVRAHEALNLEDQLGQHLADLQKADASNMQKVLSRAGDGINYIWKLLPRFAGWSEDMNQAITAQAARRMINAINPAIPDDIVKLAMKRTISRVNGNFVAAQRPTLFQGALGQTLSIFQTYNMNRYANIFRYLDGNNKALGVMFAANAGIFGGQSLPGWDTLNHLIYEKTMGQDDMTSSLHRAMGPDMADWLVYGAGSNMLKPFFGDSMAVYNRGDTMPSSMTILPSSLGELPSYNAIASSLNATVAGIQDYANSQDAAHAVGTLLATQRLNRPLRGLGELMAGEVRNSKGALMYELKNKSAMTYIARALGMRPMSEATLAEARYNLNTYHAEAEDKANEAFQNFATGVRTGNFDPQLMREALMASIESGAHPDAAMRRLKLTAMQAHQGVLTPQKKWLQTPEGQYLLKMAAGQ